jgi:hypothetical protein
MAAISRERRRWRIIGGQGQQSARAFCHDRRARGLAKGSNGRLTRAIATIHLFESRDMASLMFVVAAASPVVPPKLMLSRFFPARKRIGNEVPEVGTILPISAFQCRFAQYSGVRTKGLCGFPVAFVMRLNYIEIEGAIPWPTMP